VRELQSREGNEKERMEENENYVKKRSRSRIETKVKQTSVVKEHGRLRVEK
jgi:hypothetical protein